MVRPSRPFRGPSPAAPVAIVLCACVLASAGPPPGTWCAPGGQDAGKAAAILARARESAGGATRLAAVNGMRIVAEETMEPEEAGGSTGGTGGAIAARVPPSHVTWCMLLPDRYQRTLVTARTTVVHTLDGADFWMRTELPPLAPAAALQIRQLESDPQQLDRVKRTCRGTFAELSLLFLLKPLGGVLPEYKGTMVVGGVTGEAIQFAGTGVARVTLVFEPGSYKLLALISPRSTTQRPDDAFDVMQRVIEHRDVQGIRFPWVLQLQLARSKTVTRVVEIVVNPPLKPSDFKKPTDAARSGRTPPPEARR